MISPLIGRWPNPPEKPLTENAPILGTWPRNRVTNSLCLGQEKRTMRESEAQFENSGLI
jgi:hypothetical protein